MTQLEKNLRLMDARIRDRKAYKACGAGITVNSPEEGVELTDVLINRKLYDMVSFSLEWNRDSNKKEYTVTVWFIEDEEEEK